MKDWIAFCNEWLSKDYSIDNIKETALNLSAEYGVYPDSLQHLNGTYFFIAKHQKTKVMIVYGNNDAFNNFDSEEIDLKAGKARICKMDKNNCKILEKIFPFIKPSNHKGRNITVGFGDRLGLASPGHIRLIKDKPVFPILAQQSMRELNLTGRGYDDVLASAAWAVFQEGYTKGFGADGDHLKTRDEIVYALKNNYTMITLDCSDYINNDIFQLSASEVKEAYEGLPFEGKNSLEDKYLKKDICLKDGLRLEFTEDEYYRAVMTYINAIRYTAEVYNEIIAKFEKEIDFEMSIDETLTTTSPEAHYFVAAELIANGVKITSLAPRFCGEFQKGIDYKGDIPQFEAEFKKHVSIAEHFGYKVSVHSGSDKFRIFPIVGEKSKGKYHLKTSGTSWLEAVRLIAMTNPSLYREMHKYAVEKFSEAKAFYHVTADIAKVPDIDKLKDSELPDLMNEEDSRQVLHITYGYILSAENPDGTLKFKNDLFSILNEHEEEYYNILKTHLGKHLKKLGV